MIDFTIVLSLGLIYTGVFLIARAVASTQARTWSVVFGSMFLSVGLLLLKGA